MVVVVYTSSASANAAVKNKQKAICDFLKSRNIEFEDIDLCVHTDAKDVMRSKIPEDIKKKNEQEKKVVLPPQVFNDDEYCGDYDMFFAAREMEVLHTFFKVPPTAQEAQKMKSINWAQVENKENDANAGNVQQETTNETDGDAKAKPKEDDAKASNEDPSQNLEEKSPETHEGDAEESTGVSNDEPTENPAEKSAETHEGDATGSQGNGDTEGNIQDECDVTEGKEDQPTNENIGTGEIADSQDREDLGAEDQTTKESAT